MGPIGQGDMLNTYVGRCGKELDVFLNVVLLRGANGETISSHAAYAAVDGRRWACWLCRWLSWTVETNHCDQTLKHSTLSPRAGLLAGLQLLAVFMAIQSVFWLVVLW